jgi:hypothetical protein
VKQARAMVATTPGLPEVLRNDWKRSARFYSRFGVTETQFRHGVPPSSGATDEAVASATPTVPSPVLECRRS